MSPGFRSRRWIRFLTGSCGRHVEGRAGLDRGVPRPGVARDGVGVELHHPPHEPGAVEAACDRRAERRLRVRRRAAPDVRHARVAERQPEHLALERRPGRKLRGDGDLGLPGGDRPRRHVHHLVGLGGQVGAAKQVGRRELPGVGAVGDVRADADRAHLLLDPEAVGELRRPPVGRLQVVERLGGVREPEDADEAAVELELGDRARRAARPWESSRRRRPARTGRPPGGRPSAGTRCA